MNTEKTTKPTAADDLRMLMRDWTVTRSAWIDRFGSPDGFEAWFSKRWGFPPAAVVTQG